MHSVGGDKGYWPPAASRREYQTPRRDRLLIVYDVLSVLQNYGSLGKTRLMNLANLNTKSFREYIDEALVPLGFIEYSAAGRRKTYSITPRGLWLYGILRMIDIYTSGSIAKVYDELENELRTRGAAVRRNHGVVGGTGFVYVHDMRVEYEGRQALVTVLHDHSDAAHIEPLLGVGLALLSCIDSSNGYSHVLVVPNTATKLLAEKAVKACDVEMHIISYSLAEGPVGAAQQLLESLLQQGR